MDSPRLELSNGILFAKFRRRLSSFPFSVYFLLKIRVSMEGNSHQGRRSVFLSLWDPFPVRETKEEKEREVMWFGWTRCT
jgi:hypothetical protein